MNQSFPFFSLFLDISILIIKSLVRFLIPFCQELFALSFLIRATNGLFNSQYLGLSAAFLYFVVFIYRLFFEFYSLLGEYFSLDSLSKDSQYVAVKLSGRCSAAATACFLDGCPRHGTTWCVFPLFFTCPTFYSTAYYLTSIWLPLTICLFSVFISEYCLHFPISPSVDSLTFPFLKSGYLHLRGQ